MGKHCWYRSHERANPVHRSAHSHVSGNSVLGEGGGWPDMSVLVSSASGMVVALAGILVDIGM